MLGTKTVLQSHVYQLGMERSAGWYYIPCLLFYLTSIFQKKVTQYKNMFVVNSDWLVSSVVRSSDDKLEKNGYERLNARLQVRCWICRLRKFMWFKSAGGPVIIQAPIHIFYPKWENDLTNWPVYISIIGLYMYMYSMSQI